MSRGVSVWRVSVQGVSFQGGLCPGGSLSGGLCPGVSSGGSLSRGLCPGGLCQADLPLYGNERAVRIPTEMHSCYYVRLIWTEKNDFYLITRY